MIEVARLLRLVKDREDTAVELLVVDVILLRHPFIEEPLLGHLVVRMLRDTPVELPPRVGTQFVVASVERVLQDETAVSLTAMQLQLLPLHEITVLVQQLSIEHSAQTTRCAGVAATHIRLIIKGVAQEITGIVHVDEDLFLRQGLAKLVQAVSPAVERSGGSRLLRQGIREKGKHTKREKE